MAYSELTATPVIIVGDHSTTGGSGVTVMVPMVDGAGVPFLRRLVISPAGAVTGTADFQLNGTSSYTAVGSVWPFSPTLATRPNLVTTTTRKTSSGSPHTIAAGAISVELLVITDTATISTNGGAAVTLPANTAVTISEPGWGTPAITLTVTGSGDVLVIENRAS